MKKTPQRLCVSLLATSMLVTAVPAAMAASDVEGHWAQTTMQAFIDKGWLLGYGNGLYGPNDTLTREQFALLLNRIAGPGTPENADASALTREQAMVMAADRLGLTATDAEVAYLTTQFIDADQISDSALNSVAAMVAAGYINGTPEGSLMPQAQLTRAEGITILNNMLAVLTFDPAEHDIIYGTATLTYAEYYSGDVTSTENYGIDGVSSSTIKMFNSFNGGMHTDYTADAVESEDGAYHILGVKNVNVAVSSADYQAYKAINPSFRPIATVPNQYKTVTISDGKAVYSATKFNVVETVTDATATLQTGSTWGDYQIDVAENSTKNIRNDRSDEGWNINANIQGTILETSDGFKVGMEYLQSMWVQPWEISFNVSEDSELNAHIVQWDNLPELTKLVGKEVTSITFIMPDSTYVYTFDGIYIKPAYAGSETVTASFTEGSTEVGIAGVPEELENVTVTITCGSGRGKVTVTDAAQIQDGKVTMDSAYDSTQTYTVSVSSDNYANIIADFPATATQLQQLQDLVNQAKKLIDDGTAAQDDGVKEHYEEATALLERGDVTSTEAVDLISELTEHLSIYPDSTGGSESAEGHGGQGGHGGH